MGRVLIHLYMAQFINRLMEAVPLGAAGEAGTALPGDTRSLQRHLCVTQLGRCLGLQHALSPDRKLALIHELKQHYRHGLQFGKLLLKSELFILSMGLDSDSIFCYNEFDVLPQSCSNAQNYE